MKLNIIYGLVALLLFLGLFQLYKSSNLTENLTTNLPEKPKKQTALSQTSSTVPTKPLKISPTPHAINLNKNTANLLKPGDNDGNSTVYNINERIITFNEVLVEEPSAEPKPMNSLNCNCWPIKSKKSSHPHPHKHKHKHKKQENSQKPEKPEKPEPSQNASTNQHTRDSKTGLLTQHGPKAAAPYQLISPFH